MLLLSYEDAAVDIHTGVQVSAKRGKLIKNQWFERLSLWVN